MNSTGSSRALHILSFWIEICFSTDGKPMERDSIHTTDRPTVYMFPRIGFVRFVFRPRTTPLVQSFARVAYVCTQNTRSFHSESTAQFSVSIDKSIRKQLHKVQTKRFLSSLSILSRQKCDKHSNESFQEILLKS